MEREEDPQLWDLLRHSKVPEASPFFARNVLRAVRSEQPSTRGIASWFHLRRLVPSFSALAALVIAVFALHTLRDNRPVSRGPETVASAKVSDSELAADLDVLGDEDDNDDTPLL